MRWERTDGGVTEAKFQWTMVAERMSAVYSGIVNCEP